MVDARKDGSQLPTYHNSQQQSEHERRRRRGHGGSMPNPRRGVMGSVHLAEGHRRSLLQHFLWSAVLLSALSSQPCAAAPAVFSPQDYSPDQAGLLYISKALPNFQTYKRRAQGFGWDDTPGAQVCTWTGVQCTNGTVTGIHFTNNASVLAGNIADVLHGASLIPNLQSFDISFHALTGTLPDVNLPAVHTLDLSNNYLEGTVPLSWGASGSLPAIQNLTLGNNDLINGTLPQTWGSDGTSMRSLRVLDLNNCNFTGTLPAAWAANMPALTYINVSSNYLTGTLPAEWSTLNLTKLNLDRNALTGSIPNTWGTNGSFSHIVRLQLFSNHLSGTLPAGWAVNGTLPNLWFLDLGNNNFSGTVPVGWGKKGVTWILTSKENLFCGKRPDYQMVSCGYFRRDCIKGVGVADYCPAQPQPHPEVYYVNGTQDVGGDLIIMNQLKSTFKNFAEVARTELVGGWDEYSSMCTWQGVTCTNQGFVQGLNFSVVPRVPPVPEPLLQGRDNALLHQSLEVQLRGNVGDVLRMISRLQSLTTLDFTNQFLTGTLPSDVSFPALEVLQLANNDIMGTLPQAWGAVNAFPSLRLLSLNKNFRITGPLPDSWGGASSSMRKLEIMWLRGCNFTGGLPAAWAGNLPALSVLDMSNNELSGTLPPEWQGFGALSMLTITGNRLQGTLPFQWSANGAQSWPTLQNMDLSSNYLQGSLPGSWGSQNSMSSLRTLSFVNNNLSGPIPQGWQVNSNGSPHFVNLQSLSLLPGNPGLCGTTPQGVPVYEKDGSQSPVQVFSVGQPCPQTAAGQATYAAPSPAGAASASAGSGVNLPAVIGAVAGVVGVLALLAAAIYIIVSRRRWLAARSSSGRSSAWVSDLKNAPIDHKMAAMMAEERGEEHHHDSDSFILPDSKLAATPFSLVPFSRSPTSRAISSVSALDTTRSASATLASSAPNTTSLYSESAVPLSMGSAMLGSAAGSVGSAGSMSPRASGEHATLPAMPWKDWELNLDALAVELNEDGTEMELGKGAFGVVVKGTYRLAPVAIKRLKDQSPEQQVQFLKEMAILRACRGSRYVVNFVGASLLPGNTILAMDYMDNGNLWDALPRINKDGRHIFQWYARGRRVAYEIALGLHFLHDLRVAHLDLKSSNVLLASDGTAKIADVGLAALISRSYLSQMAPAGTWAWVAPEVILGGKVSMKADIFSFGVVLWEIITLERPAWRGNLRDIRVPEEAPQEIADLVQRCTADAELRPDAAEIADIIQHHLRQGSGTARLPSTRGSGEAPPIPPGLLRGGSGASAGSGPPSGAGAEGRGGGGAAPRSGGLPPRSAGAAITAATAAAAAPDSASSTGPPVMRTTNSGPA